MSRIVFQTEILDLPANTAATDLGTQIDRALNKVAELVADEVDSHSHVNARILSHSVAPFGNVMAVSFLIELDE